jgi:hypothetical protein
MASLKLPVMVRRISSPALYGLATGAALSVLSISQDRGAVGLIAGIGLGLELACLPLLSVLSEPEPPYAVGLEHYRRPLRVPARRIRTLIAAIMVGIMVVLLSLLPAWYGLGLMILVGAGLAAGIYLAWQTKRKRGRHQNRIYQAAERHGPRFVIYTGRGGEGSYQLQMWVPVLERLAMPYLVVLRDPKAVAATRAATAAPVVVCPYGGDLDAVMTAGLQVAFYVNGVAENSTFVGYRQLTHVYLGHGDSDKELSVHPMHAMFDKIFVAGQAAIDRYDHAGVDIPRRKFVVVGRPQLAGLTSADKPVSQIENPRVLYAPTWRGYNAKTSLSSLPWGTQIVTALIARGVAVTFSPHPFSQQGAQERHQVAAVDQLLRHDRETTGRPHRLAAECRTGSSIDEFDNSDALITDIGSVLVDYFATGKPYAVVLAGPQSANSDIRTDVPSTSAAYLIQTTTISDQGADALAPMLDDLLYRDPLQPQRHELARYYLGSKPADDRPFLEAAANLFSDSHNQAGASDRPDQSGLSQRA